MTEVTPAKTLVPPPSQYVDVDGLPVHWVDFGGPADAPLAVCVHGLGGSYVNWLSLAPLLTDRYRVVAFDLAGNGRTPIAGRRADIRSNRRLIDGFLQAADGVAGRPVTLIGNSMGGLLSMLQASRHPETVERLVLVDPAVPPPKKQLPRDPRFLASFMFMATPFVGERLMLRRGKRVPPAGLVAETMALVCQDPSRVDPELVRQSVQLARGAGREARAGQGVSVSGPLAGRRDGPAAALPGSHRRHQAAHASAFRGQGSAGAVGRR